MLYNTEVSVDFIHGFHGFPMDFMYNLLCLQQGLISPRRGLLLCRASAAALKLLLQSWGPSFVNSANNTDVQPENIQKMCVFNYLSLFMNMQIFFFPKYFQISPL